MSDVIQGDVITTVRLKHGDIQKLDGNRGGVEFRATQVPLDFYLKRKNITESEYRAGNRLFRDFEVSGQTPGMTANLNAIRGGSKNFTQAQLDARDRWREAMECDSGKIGQLMLLNVCCYGYWLKDISYLPYNPKQSLPRFREALGNLIKHYKKQIDGVTS